MNLKEARKLQDELYSTGYVLEGSTDTENTYVSKRGDKPVYITKISESIFKFNTTSQEAVIETRTNDQGQEFVVVAINVEADSGQFALKLC